MNVLQELLKQSADAPTYDKEKYFDWYVPHFYDVQRNQEGVRTLGTHVTTHAWTHQHSARLRKKAFTKIDSISLWVQGATTLHISP